MIFILQPHTFIKTQSQDNASFKYPNETKKCCILDFINNGALFTKCIYFQNR